MNWKGGSYFVMNSRRYELSLKFVATYLFSSTSIMQAATHFLALVSYVNSIDFWYISVACDNEAYDISSTVEGKIIIMVMEHKINVQITILDKMWIIKPHKIWLDGYVAPSNN